MPPAKPITVLLAEDHTVVREGLRSLLHLDGRFRVVGEAGTGREAVKLARELRPDVILMDIVMSMLNGLEATRQILAANPAARVLILSAHSDDEYIEHTSKLGVAGYLEKHTSADILTRAIREVAKGKTFFSASIARRLREIQGSPRDRNSSPKAHGLTARESEVLQLVAEGAGNKRVAAELGISVKTVEKHRQNVMNKLNIHDTAGLTRYAITKGVIESSVQLTIT